MSFIQASLGNLYPSTGVERNLMGHKKVHIQFIFNVKCLGKLLMNSSLPSNSESLFLDKAWGYSPNDSHSKTEGGG